MPAKKRPPIERIIEMLRKVLVYQDYKLADLSVWHDVTARVERS